MLMRKTASRRPCYVNRGIILTFSILILIQLFVVFKEQAKSTSSLISKDHWPLYPSPSGETLSRNISALLLSSKNVDSLIESRPELDNKNSNCSMLQFEPIAPLNESINDNLSHPHAGSRFPNGSFGYIADPRALKRTINSQVSISQNYFDRITRVSARYRIGSLYGDTILTPDHVCNLAPGRSFEGESGFKLLSEKVSVSKQVKDSPRILCMMYTYRKMRDLARLQALTWGHECDGFLAFSTETIPELGILEILHAGEESYQNMWQKVRSIWAYVHDHYLNDFDYFHLGGDDLYLVVENMRRFLKQIDTENKEKQEALFLGSWAKFSGKAFPRFVAGAPGYTLNRKALDIFASKALHTCATTFKVSHEDRMISGCLWELGIFSRDTRDPKTGEPQYHDCSPNHLYIFRADSHGSFHAKMASFWETLPHPSFPNQTTGPRHELEAASKYSIAFHDIYHPIYVARIHSILHPELCPANSVLGRAFRLYNIL